MQVQTLLPNAIPTEIYYREKQVLALFAPVHRTTWWRWIKNGSAPAPVRMGQRVTAWRKSDLELWQRGKWHQQEVTSEVVAGSQPNIA